MDDRGRSSVFLTAFVQVFGLSPFRARLRDVSQGGCKIATGTPLKTDETVVVTLPVVGEFTAFVVWSEKGFCGLRFERPLDVDRMLGRSRPAFSAASERPVPLSQWRYRPLSN